MAHVVRLYVTLPLDKPRSGDFRNKLAKSPKLAQIAIAFAGSGLSPLSCTLSLNREMIAPVDSEFGDVSSPAHIDLVCGVFLFL